MEPRLLGRGENDMELLVDILIMLQWSRAC